MADESNPTIATPPPVRATVPAGRRVSLRPQPTPSGDAAGHPITTTRRALPPGIPESLAGHINTQGSTAAAAAEALRHPSFAPISVERQQMRAQADGLRRQLISTTASGAQALKVIAESFEDFASASPEDLKAEGIDLERIGKFRDAIAAAMELTQ